MTSEMEDMKPKLNYSRTQSFHKTSSYLSKYHQMNLIQFSVPSCTFRQLGVPFQPYRLTQNKGRRTSTRISTEEPTKVTVTLNKRDTNDIQFQYREFALHHRIIGDPQRFGKRNSEQWYYQDQLPWFLQFSPPKCCS